MTMFTVDRDELLDSAGRPVRPHVSTIVHALDRLLTVATYYAAEHEQYLRASETAAAMLTEAMCPRQTVAFEIAADGLVVDGVTIDPRQKPARQLHALLVGLDLARLSISARLNAADLRQALAAFQEHRQTRLRAHSFRTLAIAGLPSTVSADSRRVGEASKANEARPTGSGDELDVLLDAWSETTGPAPAGSPVREEFLRELMAVLESAAVNLADEGQTADDAGDAESPRITAAELAEIRAGVERLLERDPGAQAITALMDLARRTLELSGDPDKARLVFEQLRKRLDDQDVGPDDAPPPDRGLAEDVSALERRVRELAERPEPLAAPQVSARRDQLAVCFRVLGAGRRDAALAAAESLLVEACGSPEIGVAEVATLADALQELARRGLGAEIDHALPPLLAALRAQRPDLLVHLWNGLDPELEAPALELLWPHLVNDLALGLDPATEPAAARCCLAAGAVDLGAALRLAPRFLVLPAAARATVSDQVFLVPPLRARGVHAVLLQGAAAERHTTRLRRELQQRPPDRLTGLIVAACADGDVADAGLLLEILREAGSAQPSPAYGAFAAALLTDTLAALPRERRDEPWTADAVAWLAANESARAAELLRRIAGERRWLVSAAWPESCRAAARGAAPNPQKER